MVQFCGYPFILARALLRTKKLRNTLLPVAMKMFDGFTAATHEIGEWLHVIFLQETLLFLSGTHMKSNNAIDFLKVVCYCFQHPNNMKICPVSSIFQNFVSHPRLVLLLRHLYFLIVVQAVVATAHQLLRTYRTQVPQKQLKMLLPCYAHQVAVPSVLGFVALANFQTAIISTAMA